MKLSKQRASIDVRNFFSQRVESVTARSCGCYVCEPVQESSRQVPAEIWALKAQLNQPINGQVQVSKLKLFVNFCRMKDERLVKTMIKRYRPRERVH